MSHNWTTLIAVVFLGAATACGPASAPPARASDAATLPTPTPLYRSVTAPTGAAAGSEWIALDTFDGRTLLAAVGRPAVAGPWPIVVVLHGDGGLRQQHLDLAEKFRASAFLTVTPCWQGYTEADAVQFNVPVGIGCAVDAPSRESATAVMKDINAIAEAARTLPGAKAGIGVVGHSAGATGGALAASLGVKVDAIVAISGAYGCGQILTRWGTCLPQQIDGLRVPLLIVHGTNDTQSNGTRIETVRAYESAVRAKGKQVETLFVDGAPHELPYSSYWTNDVRGEVAAFLTKSLAR